MSAFRRFFLFTLIAATLLHAGTPRETLLVLSKSDHTLAIVDPSTLQVVARVPVGNDPHEVIASSDGKFAYVSNYGFGAYNTLAVVDLVEQKALPAIDLGPLRGPHGLVFVGGKRGLRLKERRLLEVMTRLRRKLIGSSEQARTERI